MGYWCPALLPTFLSISTGSVFPMHSRLHILTIHLGETTGMVGENDDLFRFKAVLGQLMIRISHYKDLDRWMQLPQSPFVCQRHTQSSMVLQPAWSVRSPAYMKGVEKPLISQVSQYPTKILLPKEEIAPSEPCWQGQCLCFDP